MHRFGLPLRSIKIILIFYQINSTARRARSVYKYKHFQRAILGETISNPSAALYRKCVRSFARQSPCVHFIECLNLTLNRVTKHNPYELRPSTAHSISLPGFFPSPLLPSLLLYALFRLVNPLNFKFKSV